MAPVDGEGELEPMAGPYDWAEAIRQNPDETEFDWPEEANDAAAQVLTEETDEWLAIMATISDL